VIALELLADGTWKGTGVRGPEAFDAAPFLERMSEAGWPTGLEERSPAHVS
jgi:saccharopine dehydrogenase-like NADP-dependent oxidoreductase